MKIQCLAALLLTLATDAFVPSSSQLRFGRHQQTTLQVKVDSSEFVKKAFKASKKFGPQSNEARLAWEIVEEMDSSDNT